MALSLAEQAVGARVAYMAFGNSFEHPLILNNLKPDIYAGVWLQAALEATKTENNRITCNSAQGLASFHSAQPPVGGAAFFLVPQTAHACSFIRGIRFKIQMF